MNERRDDKRRSSRLLNTMLERVDVNVVLDEVDVDRLLDQIDIDRLLDRVDLARLLNRVDVDGLVSRVDVGALIDRVDIDAITRRAKVGELVARSTTEVAGSTLDVARRQIVGLDTLFMRFIDRLLGRDPEAQPLGPPGLVSESSEPES